MTETTITIHVPICTCRYCGKRGAFHFYRVMAVDGDVCENCLPIAKIESRRAMDASLWAMMRSFGDVPKPSRWARMRAAIFGAKEA